jgi:hypothetical protein
VGANVNNYNNLALFFVDFNLAQQFFRTCIQICASVDEKISMLLSVEILVSLPENDD